MDQITANLAATEAPVHEAAVETLPSEPVLTPDEPVEGEHASVDGVTEPQYDADGNPVEHIPADDFEDVDFEGKKYSVPKELKSALMKNADYTQKTQKLADDRRSLEQQQQFYQQKQEFDRQNIADIGKLQTLSAQCEDYNKVDWQKAISEDPQNAQAHWMQYQQLEKQRSDLQKSLDGRFQQFNVNQQQEIAKRVESEIAVLKRDIPGFNADKWGQLAQHAIDTFGFSREEIGQVVDSRLVKVLNAAFLGAQMMKAAKGGQPATKAVIKPNTVVGGQKGTTGAKPASEMSDSEWMAAQREKDKQKRK